MLEVKLNIHIERDLIHQLKQYVNSDYLWLNNNPEQKTSQYERRYMYVIDTNAFYRFDAKQNVLRELIRLDDVHSISDITQFL